MPKATRPRQYAGKYRVIDDTSREARVGANITPQPNGCWIYGDGDTDKYKGDSRTGQIHRYVYETLRGPIPVGRHLHHTCQTKACCNPDHLIPLTPSEHAKEHARLRDEAA